MLRNQSSGNGYVRVAGPNFGIGLLAGSVTDNLIEDNVITGNVTGIRVAAASASGAAPVRNVFRRNVIAGNPPILVANSVPDNAPFAFDILNLAPVAANTFENNLCITSMNAPCVVANPMAGAKPAVTSLSASPATTTRGGSFNAVFSGTSLTATTYFDIRFRSPGSVAEEVALNWQQGASASHSVAQAAAHGDWIITGVRAHVDVDDHSGPLSPIQPASIFVTFF